MQTCKPISAMLIIALLLGMTLSASADDQFLDGQSSFVITAPVNLEGKTVILHTNDVHGAIEGYAALAELRSEYEALGAEVILADAGDFSQGTTYVSMSEGHSAIEMMNLVGYDVATLGNHEIDYGFENMMANISDAEFPIVCANIFSDDTGETILPATHVIETASGLKLGFFGIDTPATATAVRPELIRDISFASFNDLYDCAQRAIDSLSDADIVIGLVHLGMNPDVSGNGYRSVDLWNKVTGVDFLIDGHSHTVMSAGENGEPIQSTGTRFRYIGIIVIDNATKQIEYHCLKRTDTVKSDPNVKAAARAIITDIDKAFGTVFATSEVLLNGNFVPGSCTGETNLGDLITDAMVWSVTKDGGFDAEKIKGTIGITNGAGIRASINAGDVTMNDVNAVSPFGDTVCVVYATGYELLEALEASTFATPTPVVGYPQTSGIVWSIDTTVPYERGEIYALNGKKSAFYAPAAVKRVSIASVNGEPFDPDAVYAVVTNEFCATGGDTYNAFSRAYNAGEGFDTGIALRDVLVDYITEVLGGTITAVDYGEPSGAQTQILPEVPAA